jgi:hypothetical protein
MDFEELELGETPYSDMGKHEREDKEDIDIWKLIFF